MAMNVTMSTAEQTAIGTASEATKQVGKIIAGLLQTHNPEQFTSYGSSFEAVGKVFIQSLMTGAVLSTAAQGAGSAIGAATGKAKLALNRSQLEKLKGITPHEMLQKVQAHIDELPNTWEPEEPSSVAHDESGQVYIKTSVTKTGQLQMADIKNNPQSVIQEGLQAIYPEEKLLTPAEVAKGTGIYKPPAVLEAEKGNFAKEMPLSHLTSRLEKKEKPGYSIEKPLYPIDRENGVDTQHRSVVFRDEEGVAKGVLEIGIDPENGKPFAFTVSISPEYQRKGIATRLINLAKNKGYNIEPASGSELFTKEGYEFYKAREKEKSSGGKQLRLALQDWRHLNPTEVQGRLNQIASDIKALQKEEKRLEAEITIKEGTGQSSQKLIDKWRKVGNAIDGLESQKGILEEGLGTTITENNKNIQLKTRALVKVFDSLTATAERLQRTKEQMAQEQLKLPEVGFKKGAFSKEREIRKIQTGLINVVNASTEDPTIRAMVKQFVNKVTNEKQALVAIDKIKEQVLKQEEAKSNKLNEVDRIKTYNAVVKLIEGKRVTLQSGHPVAQFPQATINKLQTLKGFLKDKKSLNTFLEQTALEHGDKQIGDIPADVAFKLQLANMAKALHEGDALTRNVTAANIAQWVQDGEKVIADKKAELQVIKDSTLASAKQSLGVQKGQVKYTTSQIDQIKHSINDIGAQGFTWNTLTDLITPKDKNHALTKALDESESRHNYLASVKKTNLDMVSGIEGHMKASGFKGRLIQKVFEDNNTEVQITSTGRDGKLKTDKMTRGQMLDVALKAKDESLHPALKEGNGFTFPGEVDPGTSTIEQINDALTKDDHAQLNATAEFYQSYHPTINEVYSNKYGADLPMRDNYSPVTRKGYKVDAPYSQQGLQFSNLLPGSAKTRMDSKLPLQFHNPMEDAVHHVKQWEYFKAYTDLLDRTGHILTDTDIRTHVRENYGAGTLKVLDDFHERFIKNTPVPSAPGNGWWSAMRSDFSNAIMGFRANQFFTILPHGLNTWANYSPADILHGVTQTILHPVETDRVMKQSPVFEQRTREGTNFELESSMHHSGLFGNTIGKIFGVEPSLEDQKANSAIKRYMYAAHIGADVGIQRIFGAPIYHAEIKNGATPHQALIAAERAIEQTQPGHSVSQTPYVQTNPIAHTMLAQYTQHPSQVLGKSLVAVRDWQHNMNDPKAWMNLGGKLGALWVIPGALTAAARLAPLLLANPNQSEDSNKEAGFEAVGGALMGPLESEPIIGDIIHSIWFHAAKPLIGVDESQMGGLTRGNFASEIYDNTKTALKKWEKLGEPQDPTKLEDINKEEDSRVKAEIATSKAGSMALGIPNQLTVGPISAAHQASKGDIVGAGFALGGWSPSMLAKRIMPSDEETMRKEEKRIMDSIKGVQQSSAYDTIQEYLHGLFQHEKPPASTEETSPAVKAFMEEASK
jgi:hypothetical protein